jgi:hypothetical protein
MSMSAPLAEPVAPPPEVEADGFTVPAPSTAALSEALQSRLTDRPGTAVDAETARIIGDARRQTNWKRWGPYLSEREWGTVREDYSPDGDCWTYFPFEHSHARAFRWGEDGLLGITDRQCRLCFAVALWNGKDPILKERLFGLTNPEGNHGEDVKEQYFYLDATPTASYLKALYKYPQAEFPYQWLREENRRRGRLDREFELEDTGVFKDGRYFDAVAEYAKAGQDDILIKVTVTNRGPEPAPLHVLPTLWVRNTWAWGCKHEGCWIKPIMRQTAPGSVQLDHVSLGRYRWFVDAVGGEVPELLFTDNESNLQKLWGAPTLTPWTKDAFHRYLIQGEADAVNPKRMGSKTCAVVATTLPPGGSLTLRLRLAAESERPGLTREQCFGPEFDAVFGQRVREADEFYAGRIPANLNDDERRVSRQAYAGLVWTKQFYQYIVHDWLEGDPDQPKPPESRKHGRNIDWPHLFSRDVISAPDKWEYPGPFAWDLAFHMVAFARIDPAFAKDQLVLLLREWYMHPNGQIPAYDYALSDVNPPVHAWAAWRVYQISAHGGRRDRAFLARIFQKLLINFTWWVNRKDVGGKHIFAGGFLGLDNIGVFDRSKPLPTGGSLEQADGTAWMAFYCATMLEMAVELAQDDPVYEDLASKFFEHFVAIIDAMNTLGGTGLWDEEDGFYYDELNIDGRTFPMRIRSMVGLIPLYAVSVIDVKIMNKLPGFQKRLRWFLENRKDLGRHVTFEAKNEDGRGTHFGHGVPPLGQAISGMIAIPSRERLERVLRYLLDETEFLSPYGVRSLSRAHASRPFEFRCDGQVYGVSYLSGESDSGMFGGNSNWRGPIWFPVNYILVESLQKYHAFYGDSLKVECPTGSGRMMNLSQVAQELARRLSGLFLPGLNGRCPWQGEAAVWDDPHWRNLPLFHEYFDGDTGRGLGASHQTGWTALVTRLLEDSCGVCPG